MIARQILSLLGLLAPLLPNQTDAAVIVANAAALPSAGGQSDPPTLLSTQFLFPSVATTVGALPAILQFKENR